MKKSTLQKTALMVLSIALMSCNDDDNDNDGADPVPTPEPSATVTPTPEPTATVTPNPEVLSFEISINNLTAAQPLSPALVVMHSTEWSAFTTGEPASVALEELAESGDNSSLFTEASQADTTFSVLSTGTVLTPGASQTVTIDISESRLEGAQLSVVSMPVNTNDAIAAVFDQSYTSLSVGQSVTVTGIAYDAGTELNTETALTIPGPAAGGEGFNAERDDIRDQVHVHSGVVTQDDGLATSVLSGIHKWDNPIISVTISRIQ